MMEPLPKRKHPRLEGYDYGQNGVYFVTTNVRENRCLLSTITVGRGLAPAELRLTPLGQIVQKQIAELPLRYPHLQIDNYVIMPNHLHLLLRLTGDAAGASPRPTLMQVVGGFKSLTARLCNQARQTPGETFWQTSFYERIIRSDKAYQEVWRYIDNNPAQWAQDTYYVPPNT